MTNTELIEKLKKFPPYTRVRIEIEEPYDDQAEILREDPFEVVLEDKAIIIR